MNKPLLIFLFFLLGGAVRSSAQVNLVPNPSFELYDTCPDVVVTNYFDGYVQNWKNFGFTPEYFNSCATGAAGVPCNYGGYQNAATGVAYAGIYTYESIAPNVREFVGTQLTSPLTIGVRYFVHFKVNLAIDTQHVFNHASNYIGARFSSMPYSGNEPPAINNYAHVFSTDIVSDTSSWTTIAGSFIADSAYQYVTIGCFFPDSAISIVQFQDTIYDIAAYYYVDDVYVSTDSLDVTEPVTEDSELNIFPNPALDYFIIEIPSGLNLNDVSVTMYNFLGQVIREENISIKEGEYTESRKGLRSGAYLLKIVAGEHVYYRQVIFQ